MSIVNTSGIEPMEYNVIVKPYVVPEQTKGGLFLPQDHHERVQWAETRGTVVAVSPVAFTFEPGAPTVEPGDEIMHARHAGVLIKGTDEVEYRVVKDKDVIGRVAT